MKDNWNTFLNIAGIVALFVWDWLTGETDIVYPSEVSK